MKIQPAIWVIDWKHPVHGELREVLCKTHHTEVLLATRTLGIGSGNEIPQGDKPDCSRCLAASESNPPRTYVTTRRI